VGAEGAQGDDPVRFLEQSEYRRSLLVRDLLTVDNDYAAERMAKYGLEGEGWDVLPERDPPSRALRPADVARFIAGEVIAWGSESSAPLVPAALPETQTQWADLGRRVFFEYPLRADQVYGALVSLEGALEQTGFLLVDDAWVGLRLFQDDDGIVRVGETCSQCHSSIGPDGELTGARSNRAMDVGATRLLVQGLTPGALPPELDSTSAADWDRLGPGRTDVLGDGLFNPFAFPDFGGLGDMPLLQHNANWRQQGTATLAVRCETLFITSNSQKTRPPRVLVWALSVYLRSLEPMPPLRDRGDVPQADRGEEVFTEAGCSGCHVPPLYTSESLISIQAIGTDPAAGESESRGTGYYRIPSLRGIARLAPYLHHGAFDTLQAMFQPGRDEEEPGHTYGLDLSEEDRSALIAFLETI
jgi:mono/diheme cytochrome c family protein